MNWVVLHKFWVSPKVTRTTEDSLVVNVKQFRRSRVENVKQFRRSHVVNVKQFRRSQQRLLLNYCQGDGGRFICKGYCKAFEGFFTPEQLEGVIKVLGEEEFWRSQQRIPLNWKTERKVYSNSKIYPGCFFFHSIAAASPWCVFVSLAIKCLTVTEKLLLSL